MNWEQLLVQSLSQKLCKYGKMILRLKRKTKEVEREQEANYDEFVHLS